MSERITLEIAEAKLIASLTNLVWIIPSLVVFENIMAFYFFKSASWSGGSTLFVLIAILFLVVFLKIINVVDKQLDAEREHRKQKEKNFQR